jgi:serine/threonine-protein kinase
MIGNVAGSSFPAPSALTPGYKLDRYELLCPIAQGGMASVWLARMQGKHGFEKLVAIKMILPGFATDSRFREMFLDEARIASRIEHANVAHILDLGEQHGVLYLVMEWVEGDALSKLARTIEKGGGRLPLGILLRILAEACAGLHAAHELCDAGGRPLGVVHRDVSPQNVLVNTNGVVKIIDFGVAKARDRHAEETRHGLLKGKIQYMAPEQAMGRPIDRRADVWAVGAILHRMLSGRGPFEAENQLATLHLLSSRRPPAELPPSVPNDVAAIVRRALTHDVDERFATAAELQTALEAAMHATGNSVQAGDVAAYIAEHLAERSHARKEAIALAIQSADERLRIAKVLQTNSDVSSDDGETVPGRRQLEASAGLSTKTAAPDERDPLVPTSEASVNTLASASLDRSHGGRPVSRLAKRRLAIAVAATAAAILAVILRPRAPTEEATKHPSVAETTPAREPAVPASAVVAPPTPAAKEIVNPDPPPPTVLSTAPAPPPTPRRSPKPVVSRPRKQAPASAPKRGNIDDGF